jgi:hypothetical protein
MPGPPKSYNTRVWTSTAESPPTALHPEHRVLTPQPQQVAVQGVHRGVALSFGQVELGPGKGLRVGRVGETCLHIGLGQAGELAEKRRASLAREPGEFPRKVGKVEKGARRGTFLPLKEHGCARP